MSNRLRISSNAPNGGSARGWYWRIGYATRSCGRRDLTRGLAGMRPESAAGGGLSGSFDGVENLGALVTGANKGIGKEIARQLTDAGFTVYVGSRDAARGERAVEEIGGDTRLLVLDVADDASV